MSDETAQLEQDLGEAVEAFATITRQSQLLLAGGRQKELAGFLDQFVTLAWPSVTRARELGLEELAEGFEQLIAKAEQLRHVTE